MLPKDAQVSQRRGDTIFVIPAYRLPFAHRRETHHEGRISVSSNREYGGDLESDDIDIYRDLAGGVTSANNLHGSANLSARQIRWSLKLRWANPPAKLPFEGAHPGIKFASENVKRSISVSPASPSVIRPRAWRRRDHRGAFIEARDYKKAWEDVQPALRLPAKRISSRRGGFAPRTARRKCSKAKRYVHSHCYRGRRDSDATARRERIRLQSSALFSTCLKAKDRPMN